MNILQVLPELNYGGVETGTVDFVKYLAKHGHKAVVVSGGGELVEAVESCGGIHYQIEVNKKSLFAILRSIAELARIIQKENIQIVHARSRVPAWIAYFASRKTGAVFITTCHGYYGRHIFSQVMGWGKLVIIPSQVIGRHMIDDFGLHFERVRFIPRGVDIEKFNFMPPDQRNRTEFIIAMIGRITPLKGHTHFVKAIQKVYRSIPNIKVWIVGSAPENKQRYKEDLELLVKRLGVSHIVNFLGPRRDVPEILSKVNLLVLSTLRHEAFGRVVIEAQAAGVPVVAVRVGGVVDIIDDNIDGLLVPPGDPDSMAEGIIRILRDLEFSSILAKNARSKVQSKFALEKMSEKTLDVYHEALGSIRILVIKLSALGDLILSIPALRAIRKKYPPPSRITCVVGKAVASVLVNCPYIDELVIYDFKDRDKGALNLFRIAKELRKKNFDLSLDLQNNRKSHILSALSFAPKRYGYNNGKLSFLLNKKVSPEKFILGPLEHQFRILKMLDIELKDKKIELWPSQEDERYINAFLDAEWLNRSQALVGIHLGSSSRWVTKRWPVEYIVRLSESLSLKDIRMVITGENMDKAELKVITELTRKSKPIIACGKTTINQLVCLIRHCSVFVSPDTAPLHIASGAQIPAVAIFGPTDPRRHFPLNEESIVVYKGLPCQPCYQPECKSLECMKQITVEEIEGAILKLLKAKGVAGNK